MIKDLKRRDLVYQTWPAPWRVHTDDSPVGHAQILDDDGDVVAKVNSVMLADIMVDMYNTANTIAQSDGFAYTMAEYED
jgi:hypothetical protein